MKYLIGILLLACTFSATAQKAELLVGKWKYEDINGKEEMDEEGLKFFKMMEEHFREMTMYFKENGHYKNNLMRSDEGTWSLTNKDRKIELVSNKGMGEALEILELTNERLIINLGKDVGGGIIFSRDAVTSEDEVESVLPEVETVSASLKQIAKKWYMKGTEKPDQTEKLRELGKEMMKGGTFEFKKNGKYKTKLWMLKEKGKWEFGKDKTSIIAIKGDNKKIWKIHKISETELILLKGNTEEKWLFSSVAPIE